ncbi:MAG: SRPBCC family protein [Paludibacteraceae bacterium]
MTTFESQIKKANCNEEEIFAMISDMNNIEKFKEMIPQDKIKDMEFDADSCRFSVDPVGKVGLRIIEREPSKTVKFAADQAPIDFNLWIQLKQVAENDTRIKVTVKADLNPMIKMMVSKPIEAFIERLAEGLSQLPYKELNKQV